jgi:hypothetical protein
MSIDRIFRHTLSISAVILLGIGLCAGVRFGVGGSIAERGKKIFDKEREGLWTQVTAPVAGAVISGITTISLNVGPTVQTVEFEPEGALPFTVSAPPFGWSWDTRTVPDGVRRLTIKAYGAEGPPSSSDVSVTVDNTPPQVSMQIPSGPITDEATGEITVTADDPNGISRVIFLLDGTPQITLTEPPFTWRWDITADLNGTHTLAAEAYDRSGNRSTASTNLGVAIDHQAPTISIITPPLNTTFSNNQTVSISAQVTDNVGISKVLFIQDGVTIATVTASPYSYNWSISDLDNGSHSWTAMAIDLKGNMTTSQPVLTSVDIDNTLPTASITAPAANTSYSSPQTVSITANASDNRVISKVEFYDGPTLKTTLTTAPFHYDWPISRADNGAHPWSVKAYDAAGNMSSTTTLLTVNIVPSEWENSFNVFDAAYGTRYISPTPTTDSANLAWGESYLLEAYSAMFEATRNPLYLQKAQTHIDAIFNAAAQNNDGSGWGWNTSRYSNNKILNGTFVSISTNSPIVNGLNVTVPDPWLTLASPDVCSTAQGLVQDSLPAGLAYAGGVKSASTILDGYLVSSCMDVDFGSVQSYPDILIHYWMSDTICGDSCTAPYCGTNPGGYVYVSPDKNSWKLIGGLSYVTTANATTLLPSEPFRYVRVCRGGGGSGRSNLAVDSINVFGTHTLPLNWTLGSNTTISNAYQSIDANDAYHPTGSDHAGLVIVSHPGETQSLWQSTGTYMIRPGIKTFYDISFQAAGNGRASLSIDGTETAFLDFSQSTWTLKTFSFEAPTTPGKILRLTFSASNGNIAHIDSVSVLGRVPYIVHDGMILSSVAKFVKEVYSNQPAMMAFKPKADAFLADMEREFAHDWESEWVEYAPGKGLYILPPSFTEAATSPTLPEGSSLPYNQYEAFGRYLLIMSEITGNNEYKDKAVKMGETFKQALRPLGDSEHYVWNYMDAVLPSDPSTRSSSVEDVSHSNIDVGFVSDLHRAGLVFTDQDIHRFANTFLDKTWDHATLSGHDRVDGSGPLNTPGYQYFEGWITLSSVEPRLLTEIGDFLKKPSTGKTTSNYPLMIANLLLYSQ